MLSQTTWTVAAAGVGLCFIGYCIYFDRKRRSDPFFRQKLRESTHMNLNLTADTCFKMLNITNLVELWSIVVSHHISWIYRERAPE